MGKLMGSLMFSKRITLVVMGFLIIWGLSFSDTLNAQSIPAQIRELEAVVVSLVEVSQRPIDALKILTDGETNNGNHIVARRARELLDVSRQSEFRLFDSQLVNVLNAADNLVRKGDPIKLNLTVHSSASSPTIPDATMDGSTINASLKAKARQPIPLYSGLAKKPVAFRAECGSDKIVVVRAVVVTYVDGGKECGAVLLTLQLKDSVDYVTGEIHITPYFAK